MRAINKRITVWLLLSFLIGFHFIGNCVWLYHDKTYFMHDAHHHYLFSVRIFQEMQQHLFPSLQRLSDSHVTWRWHGVFVGFITALLYPTLGLNQDAGVMASSFIFLPLLVCSTFGIAKLMFNTRAGLLASFLASMYPLVFNHLRVYMLDLPLAAMVTLCIYLLLRTEGFTSRKFSLLFGISFGLGMLTKLNCILFVIGPMFYYIFRVFRNDTEARRRAARNILIIAVCSLLVLFPYLKLKFWEIVSRVYECSWFNPKFFSTHKTFAGFFLYWLSVTLGYFIWVILELAHNIMTLPLFVLFLAGLAASFKHTFPFRGILLAWILFPLAIFMLFFHSPNMGRYLIPLLPAMAIISSGWLCAIRRRSVRVALCVAVMLFCSVQYCALSFRWRWLPEKAGFFGRGIGIEFRNRSDHFSSAPEHIVWPIEGILNSILKTRAPLPWGTNVFFIDSLPEVYEPIGYRSYLDNLGILVHICSLSEEEKYKENATPFEFISQADYVAITEKEDLKGLRIPSNVKRLIQDSRSYFFQTASRDFQLIDTYKLPEGNALMLFKNKNEYLKIGNGPLELFLRKGNLKLYYQGKGVTGFRGECTFDGKTYSSLEGDWEMVQEGDSLATARITWPQAPLMEEWKIEALGNRGCKVVVRAVALNKVRLEKRVLTFPFPHFYKYWKTQSAGGSFGKKNVLAYTIEKIIDGEKWVSVSGGKPHYPDFTVSGVSPQSNTACFLTYKKNIRLLKFVLDQPVALEKEEYDSFSFKIVLLGDRLEMIESPAGR